MRRTELLIIAFLLVSLPIAAQTITMTNPVDGTTTSDPYQSITYTFSSFASIRPTTLGLFVNGFLYLEGLDPELTWSAPNLVYEPSGPYDEGVVKCSLGVGVTTTGDPIPTLPIITDFTVDLSGPFIWDCGITGYDGPRPVTLTNPTQGGWWIVVDEYSELILDSLLVKVHGFEYRYDDLIITVTDTTIVDTFWGMLGPEVHEYSGYLVTFDPAAGGIAWAPMDEVVFEFVKIYDAPTYGDIHPLVDSPCRTFYFWIDYLGPRAEIIDPVPPRDIDVPITSCADQAFEFMVFDENGLDIESIKFVARGDTLDYSSSPYVDYDLVTIDTFFYFYVPDTVYKVIDIDTLYNWRLRCTILESEVVDTGCTLFFVDVVSPAGLNVHHFNDEEDVMSSDQVSETATDFVDAGAKYVLAYVLIPNWEDYLDIYAAHLSPLGASVYEVSTGWPLEGYCVFDTVVTGRTEALEVADMYYNIPDRWGVALDLASPSHPFFICDVWIVPTRITYTYTPLPQLAEGETIKVELLTANDMYDNELEDNNVLWTVSADRTPPIFRGHSPAHGAALINYYEPIVFMLDDIYGNIDPKSIEFHLESSSGFEIKTFGDGDTLPILPLWPDWFIWDEVAKTFTFDPALYVDSLYPTGVEWAQGETIHVQFNNFKDKIDFCDPNEWGFYHDFISFTFYIVNGPYLVEYYPENRSFVSCPTQPISFKLYDPDGIDPYTVEFMVEGEVYSLLRSDTIIVCDTITGIPDTTIIECDTFLVNSLKFDWINEFFTFTPPPGLYFNAREINCKILSAEDLLGNEMWDLGEYAWSFIIDMTGPVYFNEQPASGSWLPGDEDVIISIDVADSICGKIHEDMMKFLVNGLYFGPTTNPDVCFFDGLTFSMNLTAAGIPIGHGELVTVCLASLVDDVDYFCGPDLNNAEGLPFCWNFRVDKNAPTFSLLSPPNYSHTNCKFQTIDILVQDDIGIDPSKILFVVESRLYTIASPMLDLIGDTLRYTPLIWGWSNNQTVEWSLAQIGDIAGNIVDGNPLVGEYFVDLEPPEIANQSPYPEETIYEKLEEISFSLNDESGIKVETIELDIAVTHSEGVDEYHYVFDDGVFDIFWFGLSGGPIASVVLPLDRTDIFIPATGAEIDVEFKITDNVNFDCDVNDGVEGNWLIYNYTFYITPGWRLDFELTPVHLIIDPVSEETTWVDGEPSVLTMGAAYGATKGFDPGIDRLAPPAPPPAPDAIIPPAFILDTDRLIADFKGIEDEDPRWLLWTANARGTITWDPTQLPHYGVFIMNDRIDMREVNSYDFEPYEPIFINFSPNFMHLHKGWNLVSLPVEPDDPSLRGVFPMVLPHNIYIYNPFSLNYENPTEIHTKFAYFVLYTPGPGDPLDVYFSVPGIPTTEYEVLNMPEGWNTIGSVFDFTGVDITSPDVTTIPIDVIFGDVVYLYNTETGMYEDTRFIDAGLGYWVYIDLPGSYLSATMHVQAGWRPKSAIGDVYPINPEKIANLKIGDTKLTLIVDNNASNNVDEEYDRLMPPPPVGLNRPAYLTADRNDMQLFKDVRPDNEFTLVLNNDANLVTDNPIMVKNDNENYQLVEHDIVLKSGTYKIMLVSATKPEHLALHQNSPNPFNVSTEIIFDVPNDGFVNLGIFNMIGQKIRTLVSEEISAGQYRVVWDGCDDNGFEVISGIYFYKLTANGKTDTRKMMLLK